MSAQPCPRVSILARTSQYKNPAFAQTKYGPYPIDSKDLIWRGSAKAELDSTMTPEKAQKLINEAVQRILENFPPAGSK